MTFGREFPYVLAAGLTQRSVARRIDYNGLMKTEREQAIELVESLPDDASMVDVMYELYALRNRLRGLDPPTRDREAVVEQLRERLMLTGEP